MAENPILQQAGSKFKAQSSVSFSDIEAAMLESNEQLAAAKSQLQASTAKSDASLATLENTIPEAAKAQQSIDLQADNARLEAQNNVINAFQAAGGVEQQTKLIKELSSDQDKVRSLEAEREKILAREPTGIQLFDGIINTFGSVSTELKLDAARSEVNSSAQNFAQHGAIVESVYNTSVKTMETLNAGTINANQTLIAAEATEKLANQQLKTLQSNADNMIRLYQMDAKSVSNLVGLVQLEGEAQARELSKQSMEIRLQELEHKKELLPVQLEQARTNLESSNLALGEARSTSPHRVAGQQANHNAAVKRLNDLVQQEEEVVSTIQAGQAAWGLPIGNKANILLGMKSGGETGKQYSKLLQVGLTPNYSAGFSPYESNQNLKVMSPMGAHTETKFTRLLREAEAKHARQLVELGPNAPAANDEKGLAAGYNAIVEESIAPMRGDIKAGDSTNLFAAPPALTLFQARPIQETKLYREVLKEKQLKETSHQVILEAAVSGMQAGKLSPEEAASGIVTIFSTAMAHNNTMEGGISRIGITPQTGYPVTLDLKPFTGMDKFRAGFTKASSAAEVFPKALFPTSGIVQGLEPFVGIGDTLLHRADLTDYLQVRDTLVKLKSRQPTSTTPAE